MACSYNKQSLFLRVSVLDQCQYRCPYCLPKGIVHKFLPKSKWLSLNEYSNLAKELKKFNFTKIRFTGGEPLLRKNLPQIINIFRTNFPKSILAITTNAQYLKKRLSEIKNAGISSINVHIDTLKKEKYKSIMGNGCPDDIIENIKIAKRKSLSVKINMVVQKGINDDELIDFLKISAKIGVEVRFIEQMNTGLSSSYVTKTFISGKQILSIIKNQLVLSPINRRNSSDPAMLFQLKNNDVKFGVVASDTQPFCSNCNRVRITADGQIKGCLYEPFGQDLKAEKTLNNLFTLINNRVSYHPKTSKNSLPFSMSQIGG
ncbi:radical SAM protein [Sulfobacillus acidophilus]|uniref:Radical SAM protein n=1 Tax=Sulfobacillus acidophilus TaxID=53633 RepID=A0ABS3AWD4_9FIRM|nr:radical SAM protein [Sulfobacillus acidophilus]